MQNLNFILHIILHSFIYVIKGLNNSKIIVDVDYSIYISLITKVWTNVIGNTI